MFMPKNVVSARSKGKRKKGADSMIITEFLERNARLYGQEVALV